MQLVVGLGNPGTQYQFTRHNLGWMVLEALADQLDFPAFHLDKKFQAEYSRKGDLWLLKPQTFMNESGQSVQAFCQYYHPADVWVIHDDLDIVLGEFKIQFGVGPKIHNGLLSLENYLGTNQFWRVRVGIDNRQGESRMTGRDYVLQPFTKAERQVLEETISQVVTAVQVRLDTI